MVGEAGYRRAMRRLAQLGKELGFQVLVVANAPVPRVVADTGAELGFPVLGAYPTVQRYMQEHGIEELLGSELTVSSGDRHPSAIQHRLIAELIYRYLSQHDERLKGGADLGPPPVPRH
jgi:hypothetical protein